MCTLNNIAAILAVGLAPLSIASGLSYPTVKQNALQLIKVSNSIFLFLS